jgi:O-antigen/teichoic acid export membrane protein
MLNSTSVKTRLIVSICSNILRAALSFFTGVVVARSLNPSGYGDLMFLLGSFAAIRGLLDMGCSNAFYTFLARHKRGLRFYLLYLAWLIAQFILTILLVTLLIPTGIFESLWLGHDREVVLLAFLAAFLQQQLWQTVSQIGEAMRKTVKVQLLNLCIAIFYLAATIILSMSEKISIQNVLVLLIGIYGVAVLLGYHFLTKGEQWTVKENTSINAIVREYWVYCRPMLALPLVGFLYNFSDKWMLQRFGGATELGYFQVANQISVVSLLATTSILGIFWKEIAEALARNDQNRVAMLYSKVSRGLVMIGAIVTGLLLPWSEQIVGIVLGAAYLPGWPVLAIMLLYPIHQSLGQIGGTMLLASARTHLVMRLSLFFMSLSMPFSYLMLAPTGSNFMPGFELGALGIAWKMVLLNAVSVNVQAWLIARYSGWKFDWTFQAVGIPLMIGLGYLAKSLVALYWNLDGFDTSELIFPVLLASSVYAFFVLIAIWSLPWLVSMNRTNLKNLMVKSG